MCLVHRDDLVRELPTQVVDLFLGHQMVGRVIVGAWRDAIVEVWVHGRVQAQNAGRVQRAIILHRIRWNVDVDRCPVRCGVIKHLRELDLVEAASHVIPNVNRDEFIPGAAARRGRDRKDREQGGGKCGSNRTTEQPSGVTHLVLLRSRT